MKLLCLSVVCAGIMLAQIPECPAGWNADGKLRAYKGDNLFEYMDGNAEGYLIYGFAQMRGVTCQRAGVKALIDISEMNDAESAWGLFAANRDVEKPVEPLGASAQFTLRKAILLKSKFFLEIAAEPEGDHTAALRELAATIEKSLPGTSALPEPLGWFPETGLNKASFRLIAESVLGLRGLKRGYVAQYENGSAFLVKESSDTAARAAYAKLKARIAEPTPASVADEAVTAADKYLGKLCVFRKGPFIGGFVKMTDPADPIAAATQLAAKISASGSH